MNSKLYRFLHKFTPKLERCPKCNKRFFLKYEEWSYDKYVSKYDNGITKTLCKRCSKEVDE